MTYKTKGIVLRTIKYGETSLVVTLFTELFGVQTYLVNGVRSTKRTGNKAVMLQPAAILDLEVYHNDLKNLQRIKECSWAVIYNEVLSDVIRNSIAMYMVELLYKVLKQPEPQPDLFYFCEDVFQQLDQTETAVAANFPLFFTLQLPQFFGFRMNDPLNSNDQSTALYLDLKEGNFTSTPPQHPHFMEGNHALLTAELLKIMHPKELTEIKLNHHTRRELLFKYLDYYALHVHEFGPMKTIAVLHEVLG